MPPDPARIEDTRAWLDKAAGDLRAGAHSLTAEPPLTFDVTFHGGCTTNCKRGPLCGDGVTDSPHEQCDVGGANGHNLGYGGCTFGCLTPHYCGDGNIDQGEECDMGALNGVALDAQMQPSDATNAKFYCSKDCTINIAVL